MSSTPAAPWLDVDPDEWLRHVLAIHFHPRHGTPFWLERQERLGIDVLDAVRTRDDLLLLGPMPEAELARRPLEDLVPRPLLERRSEWRIAETGGTLGRPKTTLWLDRELDRVFVDPFTAVARRCGFPEGERWLFAGPTGPHVIGRAARRNARALGSPEPFTLDFDPRWAKRLVPGSLGQRRYLAHVVDQALRVIRQQGVGVLFTTPVMLRELARELDDEERAGIRGVFYGGMALDADDFDLFTRRAFPGAVHLAGYGNTLLGLALQIAPATEPRFEYHVPGARLHLRLVRPDDDETNDAERLPHDVRPGERGQVVASRLDESFLLVNLMERDEAERLPAAGAAAPFPTVNPGLGDPAPAASRRATGRTGFY